MKRQILFIQGGGQATHDEWDNKLVDSLRRELGKDYEVLYPRMPREEEPKYESWKTAIQKEVKALNADAILIGHSIGGTILLGVLAASALVQQAGAIILISAPFVGDGGWPSDDMQFPADLGAQLPRGVPVHLFHGLQDETAPPKHVDLYARAIPQAQVHRLPKRDHQLNDDLGEVANAIRSLEK